MQAQSTATGPTTATTFKPRVRRLGPGRYLVESASHPGIGHPVTLDRCTCPGYAYRGNCRHITLVRAIAPRMEAWYAQAPQARQQGKAAHPAARPATTDGYCTACGDADRYLRDGLCVLCEMDAKDARAATRPAGMAALQEAFGA